MFVSPNTYDTSIGKYIKYDILTKSAAVVPRKPLILDASNYAINVLITQM